MNFTQYLKNKKTAIEEYLQNPNDPITCYKLFKPRKNSFFNEQNKYLCSKIIRKNLQNTKDQLHNKSQIHHFHDNVYTKGLYHDRNDDLYDINHIHCVEDGFCMKHPRKYSESAYKHHYQCKHGMCTNSYKQSNMVHGEIKWYSSKFVCFNCRRCITSRLKAHDSLIEKWPKCAHCHTHMTSVSVSFQPPVKHNIKHWKKLDDEWYDDSRLTYDEYKKILMI